MVTGARAVPRDLLPLPDERSDHLRQVRSLGRASAQRLGRERAVAGRLQETVRSLNSLFGEGEFRGERPSLAQQSALDSIERVIRDDIPPLDWDETAEASLQAMLGSRANVYETTDPMALATLSPESTIAWPKTAGSMPLVEALPRSDADILTRVHDRLVKSPEEFKSTLSREGRCGMYWDKLLSSDPDSYHAFVSELHGRQMISFQQHAPLEQCSIFFVHKKDGSLRMICDARRSNQRLRAPPRLVWLRPLVCLNCVLKVPSLLIFRSRTSRIVSFNLKFLMPCNNFMV